MIEIYDPVNRWLKDVEIPERGGLRLGGRGGGGGGWERVGESNWRKLTGLAVLSESVKRFVDMAFAAFVI